MVNQHTTYKTINKIYDKLKIVIYTILVILLIGCSFSLGMGLGLFASLVKDTPIPTQNQMNETLHKAAQKSTLTYSNGEAIATLHSDIVRTNVDYSEISPNVINALISIEDPDFYKHHGVTPKSILRAVIQNVTGDNSPSGGSTLTQQLVKQQFLSNDQTLSRKAKEILLSYRVEKYFSKKDILTTYLNISSFGRNNKGQNIAGIEEAAMGIFGVPASQLSIPQAAFLAGLPQSPIIYSPYTENGELKSDKDLEYGLYRKDLVLNSMYRHNIITKSEYDAAKNYDLKKDFLKPNHQNTNNASYLYFAIRNAAIQKLMPRFYEKDGWTKDDILQSPDKYNKYYQMAEHNLTTGGYQIQSTIDKNVYNAMQNAIKNYGNKLNETKNKEVQVGNVLMDNRTGKIYGFISGKDYNKNQVDHAFSTYRSPASTMKPIIAYAPAIDIGLINSRTMLNDFSFTYSKTYKPVYNFGKTSGNKFESVYDALIQSDNIPVANLYRTLLEKTNPYNYIKNMNMGISDKQVHYESAPLGTNDVSVVTQTGAYATLANNGKFNEPYLIEKIIDSNGNIIYQHQATNKQVFKPETASIMNDMMRGVIRDDKGTGHHVLEQLKSLNSPVQDADLVGKTGSAEDGKDYWFIASTPKITLSSWIGYDDNKPMNNNLHKRNMEYWAYLINTIYQTNPNLIGVNQKFTLLPSVVKEDVSNKTGTRFGDFNYNGEQYSVPGDKVQGLGINSNAFEDPKYQFGIGGTLNQYNKFWNETK